MVKILIVDDDVTFCLMLKTFLQKRGYEVEEAFSFSEGSKKLNTFVPDIILSDLRLPDKDGIALLEMVMREKPQIPVVLMTGYADIRTAVQAMKMGAFEYVAKPISPDEILATIVAALKVDSGKENRAVRKVKKESVSRFVDGTSSVALKTLEYIHLVAPTAMSVLIIGESGTGKEFVARRIHELSDRRDKPFVAIDCGALPKDLAASEFFGHLKGSFTGAINDKVGQFEAANGGTLFLDEVGNLSYEVQMQLLRVLQERRIRRVGANSEIPVDIRILAATNDDLRIEVQQGNFREDLFHRLNEFSVVVHPLRDRRADLPEFVDHFLATANVELNRTVEGLSGEVMHVFTTYSWPGNLRELKNVVKRSVLLSKGPIVGIEALPEELVKESTKHNNHNEEERSLRGAAAKGEHELILQTLEKVKYNKTKAAQLLNIDRKTLYNKMKQYDIDF
ncbi:MAG TPA: sigma-54 dependent transcriptional regulator [Williamwhitmania sp.]|nr:sigma-54 dependent transcriptional regulator [Williamwhitmania sp.]